MQARIRDLFALADHLQLQRFHFVGESYGGTLGLAAGLQAPDRFGSLCIVNASYHGTRLTNTQEFEATVALKGVKAWSDEVLQGRFFRDSLSDEMWEWYSAQQANHSMTSIISILRELRAADMSDQLERLTLPVLYLHSDSSPFISVSVAQDMHSKTRGSELQIFAHSKHGLPFTHGKPCSAALFEFLQRLNGRAQPGINP